MRRFGEAQYARSEPKHIRAGEVFDAIIPEMEAALLGQKGAKAALDAAADAANKLLKTWSAATRPWPSDPHPPGRAAGERSTHFLGTRLIRVKRKARRIRVARALGRAHQVLQGIRV